MANKCLTFALQIVTTLQWCGLLTVQDTGTPPLLDAIYEQTARGAAGRSDLVDCSDLSYEHGKGQAITGSLGYAHLVIQLSEHKRELQHARTWRETQEREAQRTYAKFVDSQNNLHRQLEFSRAREQNLHADLFAAEKEHEKLKALISSLEASNREQQGWEEVAATAKTRCAEAEVTASKLRVDLAAAVDRVCNVQDQLVRQMELASDKDKLIQTITEESRRAHTKLRCAEDKIKRLDARLLDRRVPERKPLDGQVVIRDRHERRQSQDLLRDPPPLDRNLQPRYRRPTTTLPDDTGQTPLPPEQIRYTGTLPVSSAINLNPDPTLRPAKCLPDSSSQDQKELTPHMRACLLQIAGSFDKESEVVKEQRASPEELTRLMRRSPIIPLDVKAKERELLRDEVVRLKEQLVVAKEKQLIAEEEARDARRELDQSKVTLREAEEEGRGVRRELDQSKETLREVESHVMALEYELGLCQATLREAQDARHASKVELDEMAQLLRQHQVESESSTAMAEASQLKCSQATLLSAALQERVTELEAQVKTLKDTQKHPATRAVHPDPRSLCPTATGT